MYTILHSSYFDWVIPTLLCLHVKMADVHEIKLFVVNKQQLRLFEIFS